MLGTLEPAILLCVAILNIHQRHRGYALTRAPSGFRRTVPIPVLPPLLRPTVRPADVRVGLTASRAFQILTNRKAEEMRLLIDAFEGRFEGWEEAVHAPGTAAMETMSWPNEVVQLSS